MADISVSLELDDSKYKSGLSAAERSAKQFSSSVNTGLLGNNQAFNTMAQGLDSINSKFQTLSRVLVGAGIVGFANSLLKSADNLVDMARALDVSTARMMEMGTAATMAGGNLETMTTMLGKMEQNIGDALNGNAALQKSLTAVGVSIGDINSKSPDQLFNQIAVAISKVEDPMKRSALATDLFGKSAKIINFKDYVQGIVSVYGSMDQYARSQEDAARINQQLEIQVGLLKNAFTSMLAPVLSLVAPTDDMGGAMTRAKVAAGVLGVALAGFVGTQVVQGIAAVGAGVRSLATFMGISTTATKVGTIVTAENTITTIANANAQAFLAGAAGRVGAAYTAVAIAQANLNALQAGGIATAAELTAAETALTAAQARLAAATTAAAETQAVLTGVQTAGVGSASTAAAANTALGASFLRLSGIIAGVAGVLALFYSSDLNAGEDEEIAKINALGKALGMMSKEEQDRYKKLSAYEQNRIKDTIIQNSLSKEQADIMSKVTGQGQTPTGNSSFAESPEAKAARERMLAATKNEANAIYDTLRAQRSSNDERERSLRFQIESLSISEKDRLLSQMSERDKIVQSAAYEAEKQYLTETSNLQAKIYKIRTTGTTEEKAQIESLYTLQKNLRTEYEAHLPILKELANQYATLQEARQLNLFTISEEIKRQNQLIQLQDDMAKLTMTEIEKKYYDIEAAARASAKAAIEAEEARRGARLAPEEAKAYYDAALKGTEELIQKQKELYDQSREFSTGWERAFKEYQENATNAAKQAETIFAKATQGMEDAIVNFAKTGKFEWKSFVSSIVEEMLRQQVRQLIANTFGGLFGGASGGSSGGGGGGLLGLGGVLGFLAGGGPAMANQPYIVGERGPELFVPNLTGTVVPNNKLSSQGVGSTNVIYNINAVDAMSFKQMVARDPSFIYAVSQQGAKSIPSTRR
jgi:phage-related minor tail protein